MSGKGKEGRVPQIRFAGFTDPWEQRKLGAMTAVLSAARVHKEEWQTEGVPFYRSSDVMSAFNGTQNEKVFISQELFDRLSSQSGAPQKGDVLVTGGGSVGTPYIVPDNKPLYTKDADLIWIKRHAMIDPEFLYSFFASPIFRAYIQSISHVGTIAHYTIEQVKETPLTMPCSIVEQKAIGSFLSNLDHLITLHQRKYDKLCAVKKSMLDKMFPKGGSLYPEIRFAGFTDPWEQRKLGDVGYATSGIGFPDAEQGGKEGIPFFKVSDMNLPENSRELVTSNNYVTESQIAANGWHPIANLPAIFFAKVGAAVYLNRKRLVDTPFLLDNNTMAFSLDTEKISSSFAQSLFEGIDLTALTQVGALPSLNAADIESLETLMPLDMGEQVKIGRYFANLDSLITLHQRKLELLRNIKKAMLDKMFA